MDIFTKDIAIHQGRIQKAGAPEGSFVYELGHALLRDCIVKVGDYHEVSQEFMKHVDSKFIAPNITVVTPAALPVGALWLVSAKLNNVLMVYRELRTSKRPIVLEDWRINLANALPAPGKNTITFRLELIPGA